MNRLKKIGDFAFLALGVCGGVAMWVCIAAIIGVFITDPLLPASFTDTLRESSTILFVAFNATVGSLALLGGWLIWRAWKRKEQGQSFSAEAKLLHDFLATRKLWITALSMAAALLGKSVADGWVEHHKRFDEADRVAAGHVVEVDPGEPSTGAGEDADPGRNPSSHYKFRVNGVSYDGWIGDELSQGEELLIRYNSSDPNFNHAQGDHRSFYDDNWHTIFLLIVVVAAIGWWICRRKPDEPEAEIDIGDGSFENLRREMVERLHRDPTPKEEAKLRKLAGRIQKASQEEKAAMQKLVDAIENYKG